MFLNYYPENFVIETLIIFVIIFLFLYRNINTIVYPTIVFICAIIVTFMYQNSELEKILDNEEKHNNNLNKLDFIMNKEYNDIFNEYYDFIIHKNNAIAKVFSNILPYADFSVENFKEALLSTNELIRVYESSKLGHKFPKHTIDIAEELKRNILNSLQSVSHSFPSSSLNTFESNITILSKILQKIINDIKLIYKTEYKKYGPDIYNPPPDVNSGEWSNPLNEKNYNKYWNFHY